MPGQKRVFALDVPGIHAFQNNDKQNANGWDKLGHDEL
jgi:hypothetical protein